MRATIVLVILVMTSAPLYGDSRVLQPRPRIGIAFGGGSARGLAHVGVVRWFEEHRIPIDVIAGTSMGGLIGGGIASGMSAAELSALLAEINWDEMFGFSPFQYKNIRRKEDTRAYPSRIELGIKHGVSLPIALNSGQQVEFLLARIAGQYATLSSFDDLPTPFRAVAVDLVTAQEVVLDKGSLASALRATMSLPGIFPPVERDGMVLVDGGALNNVPADVVRQMGADVVIAIDVGATRDAADVNRSLLGLMGQTVDVMMQASTRATMKSADVVIHPMLKEFGSLDWRRSAELEAEGYRAAAAMSAELLQFALDEPQWAAYLDARRARRKRTWPAPQFLSIEGTSPSDRARIEAMLTPLIGQRTLDLHVLETTLEAAAGLDRYESVGWAIDEQDGRPGLRIEAREKSHAPPFLMLGVSLENTTSDTFAFQLTGRYLTFDLVGSGSELRVDAAVGAQARVGAELYRPLGRSALFVAAGAAARHETLNFVEDDVIRARYNEDRALVAFDGGVNLGRDSDVRVGVSTGNLNASVDAGDPGLPALSGQETKARLVWRYDGQDSPVVPSRGLRANATLDHFLSSPPLPSEFETNRTNVDVTQLEIRTSMFWPVRTRDRLFVAAGFGTTWGHPLPNEQFQLGAPFRLGAYAHGEFRGDHYGVVSAGYARAIGRLPDFLGGSIYLGGWVENGSAFDDIDDATFRSNVSAGAVADTLVGPVLLGMSFDFSGASRYYIGIGRLF
jgi:NTE family protein